MNGYLSQIIQRNVQPEAGLATTSNMMPDQGISQVFGPANITFQERGELFKDGREALNPLSSPAAPPLPQRRETEASPPPPKRIEHQSPVGYIERHVIRTGPSAVPTSGLSRSNTRAGKETGVDSPTPLINTKTPFPSIAKPVDETLNMSIRPVAEEIKPRSEYRMAHLPEDKTGRALPRLRPATDQAPLELLKPVNFPAIVPLPGKKVLNTPKLVIGKLTVEVLSPVPKMQTIERPAHRPPTPPESRPYTPYNKLTFGLGQL